MSDIQYEKDGENLKVTVPKEPEVVIYSREALEDELNRYMITKQTAETEIARLQALIDKADQLGV